MISGYAPEVFDDSRGKLVVFELPSNFKAKRIYYIKHVATGASRGGHAHMKLKQFFVVIQGSMTLRISDGFSWEAVCLSDKSSGIFLGQGLWRELTEFSPDCICLVLASDNYDPNDYIRNWDNFVQWRQSLAKC